MSKMKRLDGFDEIPFDDDEDAGSCSRCLFAVDVENAFGGSDYVCGPTGEDVTFATGRLCFTEADG